MKKDKVPMDPLKKAKLIYSSELIVFSVIFIILGVLKCVGVIKNSDTAKWVFTWITIIAATWGVIDFIWAVTSKKRQQRICLIDKFTILPLTIYMILIDAFTFAGMPYVSSNRDLFIGIIFFYAAAIYIFQGIYHYYKPLPAIVKAVYEDLEEEKKKKEAEENASSEQKEENN